jgi:hypothetical protein
MNLRYSGLDASSPASRMQTTRLSTTDIVLLLVIIGFISVFVLKDQSSNPIGLIKLAIAEGGTLALSAILFVRIRRLKRSWD